GFSQKGKLPAYRRSRRNSWDVNAAFTRRGEAAAHVPHSPRRISRARAIRSPRALGRGISRPPQRVLVPTPLPWSSAVRAAARRLPLALRTRMSVEGLSVRRFERLGVDLRLLAINLGKDCRF